MILFEEEQLKKNLHPDLFDLIKPQLNPIELPSDEEIAKHMTSVWFADNMHRECFKLGSIWMKTQIKNQIK